jgi:hypothetical protein
MKLFLNRVLPGVAVLLLLGLAYIGITGGIDQFDQSTHSQYTVGQFVQTVLQLAFGVSSLAAIAAWFWARRWSARVFAAFVVSLTLAGGLASVVWGGTSITIGVVSGLASLAVGWVIVWLLRFSARGGA